MLKLGVINISLKFVYLQLESNNFALLLAFEYETCYYLAPNVGRHIIFTVLLKFTYCLESKSLV